MSWAKEYLAEEENAMRILLKIGAIATCEIHDDHVYRTSKYTDDEVYAIATKEYNKSNYKAFHDAIKVVLNNVNIDSECPYCRKMLEDD